jgi:hypothetical protein
MRLSKSWTLYDYKRCYKLLRRGRSFDEIWFEPKTNREALKAADYSYQAKGYEVHGWSNDTRHKRFHNIKWRILTNWEVFPF